MYDKSLVTILNNIKAKITFKKVVILNIILIIIIIILLTSKYIQEDTRDAIINLLKDIPIHDLCYLLF